MREQLIEADGTPGQAATETSPLCIRSRRKAAEERTLSSADEAGFIRNGKAEVQVWLTEKSEAALAKLKELGFEVVLDAKNSKTDHRSASG